MSLDAPPRRPAPQRAAHGHVHDRSCWWDLTQCRWAGPAHPDLTRRADETVPGPPPSSQT